MNYDEYQLEFSKGYTLPDAASIYAESLQKDVGRLREDDPFPEELMDNAYIYPEFPDHHLLGYAHTLQGNQEQLDWRLLFQFSLDEIDGSGGASVNFYFSIKSEALRNCDFNDVRVDVLN
ncbi:MAG: DUF1963 domain-containing protein [Candidatus Omnitrophota bacterium]